MICEPAMIVLVTLQVGSFVKCFQIGVDQTCNSYCISAITVKGELSLFRYDFTYNYAVTHDTFKTFDLMSG